MNGSLLVFLACVLKVSVCNEMGEDTCAGNECEVPGKSILHVKDVFDIQQPQEVEEEGSVSDKSVESKPELNLRQEGGMLIETYGKFEIRSHESVSTSSDDNITWILSFPGGCSSSCLEKVESAMLLEMKEDFKSDKEHGGMPVLMMNGTLTSLKKGLKHLEEIENIMEEINNNIIIESDAEMHALPVMKPSEDADAGSLLDTMKKPKSWGLDRVDDRSGLDQKYSSPDGLTGAGVHVFVFDTGIWTSHTDFGGRAVNTLDATTGTPDPVECKGDATCAHDLRGHGTHCAGTIGGTSYGVAKDSTLHAVKVLSDEGRGTISGIVKAMDWVEKHGTLGPAVGSFSLGGKGQHLAFQTAADEIIAAGVVLVVAAGNEDDDACGYSPAFVPKVITVGATTKNDERADFSNYGSCVDIFAPGKDIVSAYTGSDIRTREASGTSMACPHVSGAAALILSEDPTRTVIDVERLLKERATTGAIADVQGSVNRLLYTGLDTEPPTPAPVPTPAPTIPPTPAPMPTPVANCSFEEKKKNGAYCGLWHDADYVDQFDWSRTKGKTRSISTGPTEAADGRYYLYIETSEPRVEGDSAILETPPLVLATDLTTMRFQYHMWAEYERIMGTLAVTVDGAEVWSKSDTQGNYWRVGLVDLSQYKGTNPRIAFKGTAGNDFMGDAAIDAIEFILPPQPLTVPLANCSFESRITADGYCGLWHDSTDDGGDWVQRAGATWTHYTGPSGAAEGEKYLHIDASWINTGATVVLETHLLDYSADTVMKFKYHMWSGVSQRLGGMGSLAVLVNGTEVWSKSGDQGDVWKDGEVDISQYKDTKPSIAFMATCGGTWSDIAIDKIDFVAPSGNPS